MDEGFIHLQSSIELEDLNFIYSFSVLDVKFLQMSICSFRLI